MRKTLIFRLLFGLIVLAGFALAVVYLVLPQLNLGRVQVAGIAVGSRPSPGLVHYQTARVQRVTLDNAISTTGVVRSNQTAVLIWQTSGSVEQVNVGKGQEVKTRTVLATLEQTSLPTSIINAQADLVTAQKALDTLLQSTQARANAQLALVRAQKALEDARKHRPDKLYQRASRETIDIARARLITANQALDDAETAFSHVSARGKEDVVYAAALSELAKARQNQITAQYNLNYVMGLPDPLDVQEADAIIAVDEANVLQAQLDWERVKDGPNDQDVSAAQARVAAAQAALNLARIAAPFDGTITLASSKVGDQVSPGSVAFQLDDLSHLYVDMSVAEDDIAQVQVGQPVTLTLDALPRKEFTGTVTEIGAVGNAIGGTVNFTVTVEINSPGATIRPGMTISASIKVGPAQSALLVPTRAVHTGLNGERIIYLLKNGAPAPVAINPGEATGADTPITAGAVEEGNLVIVNLTEQQIAALNLPAAKDLPTAVPLPSETAVVAGASAETAAGAQPASPDMPAATPEEIKPSAVGEDPAAAAVHTYAQALQGSDFTAAAQSFSNFSLMLDGVTRSAAADALQAQMAQGLKWSDFQVDKSRVIAGTPDMTTMLVHVAYKLATKDAKTGQTTQTQIAEDWPVRLEDGKWMVNRGGLIDYHTLNVTEKTTAGLTIRPLQLTRYADRLRLTMLVQNQTNDTIVLGQPNEIMAAFTFGDQQVEAVKKQLIFQRLRSYPDTFIEVKGLFETYPDGVIIRQWKGIKVPPWFVFKFNR